MTDQTTKSKRDRMTHNLDASDQIAGRLASKAANLLIGKHKTTYRPNLDNGDSVVIANVDKLRFSGKKLSQNIFYRASGYPGGLKELPISSLFQQKPEFVFKNIVKGMLPKNKHQKNVLKRLTFKSK